jgi:hypothetical protein
MRTDFWIDAVGWVGAIILLFAYLMISIRRWDSASVSYQGSNLFGGVCLIVNTIYFGAYPSSFVNLVWIGIAIYSLARRNLKSRLSKP